MTMMTTTKVVRYLEVTRRELLDENFNITVLVHSIYLFSSSKKKKKKMENAVNMQEYVQYTSISIAEE